MPIDGVCSRVKQLRQVRHRRIWHSTRSTTARYVNFTVTGANSQTPTYVVYYCRSIPACSRNSSARPMDC